MGAIVPLAALLGGVLCLVGAFMNIMDAADEQADMDADRHAEDERRVGEAARRLREARLRWGCWKAARQ